MTTRPVVVLIKTMGIVDAKKYITDLRRKQGDPAQWPDFLTGLPDKTVIVRKVNDVFSRLDRYAVTYVRIVNVEPYLLKYGSERHMEIIQWAAAILKTTIDRYQGFLGAYDTHDFVVICRKKDVKAFLDEASDTFRKKIKSFYSEEDLKKKAVLSFTKDDRKIDMGLMDLLSVSTEELPTVPEDRLVAHLAKLVNRLEKK